MTRKSLFLALAISSLASVALAEEAVRPNQSSYPPAQLAAQQAFNTPNPLAARVDRLRLLKAEALSQANPLVSRTTRLRNLTEAAGS